jgi:protein-tyrosine-phosphatase
MAPALRTRFVPDPYYGTQKDFERVIELVEGAAPALLARVRAGMPHA